MTLLRVVSTKYHHRIEARETLLVNRPFWFTIDSKEHIMSESELDDLIEILTQFRDLWQAQKKD